MPPTQTHRGVVVLSSFLAHTHTNGCRNIYQNIPVFHNLRSARRSKGDESVCVCVLWSALEASCWFHVCGSIESLADEPPSPGPLPSRSILSHLCFKDHSTAHKALCFFFFSVLKVFEEEKGQGRVCVLGATCFNSNTCISSVLLLALAVTVSRLVFFASSLPLLLAVFLSPSLPSFLGLRSL